MNDGMLQIGEVAERAGLSLRTVRYYEESGLLQPARRTDGGFRLYTDEHLDLLELIKRMKPLGFSVQEMRELLDARQALRDEDAGGEAREQARQRLARFAAMAGEACDQLRDKLAEGDELVKQLRRESRRPRAAAGQS